jgi:soluble lytic murein transglycosylase-like protein
MEMRKSLGLNSAVTAAFLILCSASGSNAEPDASIEHAAAPVEATQDQNMTVVPDRDANVSTAQTVNDAAKIMPSVSIAPANISCDTLNSAAATHGLPLEFFTRLIRQESNFNPNSVGRAGAQGIAQFMPGTARWRGLSDPFELTEALYESARWLSELRNQFGNLGLAAAAYNAGHGASGNGLRVAVSFHEKREPTFVSSPVGQQKVGLECRRRFRTIDHRVPAFRRQKARPRSKATSAWKKKRIGVLGDFN